MRNIRGLTKRNRRLLALFGGLLLVAAIATGVARAAPTTYTDRALPVTFPQGDDSFADVVDGLDRNGDTDVPAQDGSLSLAPPDDPPTQTLPSLSTTLGDGGSITLRWSDNALTGSGDADPDIYVFEKGSNVEIVDVYVAAGSPSSACPSSLASYTLVGRTTTLGGGIDIDDDGFTPSSRIHCVRVVDVLSDQNNAIAAYDGADIDAVGAIETVLYNDAPVNTVPGTQTTAENTDEVFAGTISVADRDAETGSVRVTLTATNGTLTPGGTTTGVTVTGSGTSTLVLTGTVGNVNTALNGLTFRPNTNFAGTASLQVNTNDQGNTGEGGPKADTDSLSITVTEGNDVPVITTSTGSVAYLPGDPATVADPGVAVADVDSTNFNGGYLRVDFSDGGTADDRLAVRNQGTANGQISVNTSTRVVSYTTGGVTSRIGIYNSGGGVGTTALTITLDQNAATVAAVQALARNITYQNVNGNPSGTRTVRFVANDGDGGTSDPAYRQINIGTIPPTISDVADRTTNEDTATPAIPFTVGDTDDGAASLTTSASSSNTTLVPNGNISFGGSGANRTVTITPAQNQTGTTTITLTVTDPDGATATDTFVLTVTPVNDPPVLSLPGGPVSYAENAGPTVIDGGATVVDVDSANFDTGNLTVDFSANGSADDRLTIFPGNGVTVSGNSVSYNGTQIGTFAGGSGTTPLVVTFNANASQAAVQALAGRVAFSNVSEAPSTAARTVRFVVTDGDGGTSAAVTETVNVSAANDAPTISDIADRTIPEDGSTGDIAFSVNDPDSGSLTLSAGSSDTTLVPNGNISFGGSGANRTVRVTPAANRSGGPVTISVTVSDGSQSATDTFQLDVTPVNDAPSFDLPANPDQTVNEDAGAQTVANFATNVSAGPFENQDVSFEITNNTNPSLFSAGPAISQNGNLTYTPAANASGTATITVRARDNGGTAGGGVDTSAPRTFTISVNPVNDRPTADNDGPYSTDEDTRLDVPAGQGVLVGDADAEGATLDAELVSGPAEGNLTLHPDGSFRYDPAPNDSGDVTFTYRACERGTSPKVCSDPATVTISVLPVNDAPTISGIADRTIPEDGSTGDISFTIDDPDGPTGNLTLAATSSDQTLVPDSNLTFGGSGANRTVKATPAANRSGGPVTISVTVSDGTGPGSRSFTETFELDVTPVNDEPGFTKGDDQAVAEDAGAQSVAGWATGISEGPLEDQDVTFEVTNDDNGLFTAEGQPTVAPDGTLSYTPAANGHGTALVTVRARDDGPGNPPDDNTSAPQTFTITVTAVNDAPTVTLQGGPATDAVEEGDGVYTFEFSVNDPDNGDGFQIKQGFPSCGTGGTLVGEPTTTASGGSFRCRFPDGGATPTVRIQVTDGDEDSEVASRGLDVENVAPAAQDDEATADEDGQAVVVDVLGNDTDPAGAEDPLQVSIVDGPPNGQGTVEVFTDPGDGRQKVRYTPDPDFEGQGTSFTYSVSDGDGGTSNVATVTVALNPVNDAPVAEDAGRTVAEDDGPIAVDLADLVSDAETSDADLTYEIVGGPTATQGTLTRDGSTITFEPAEDFNGTVEIDYKVRDRGDPDDCGAPNAGCDATEESAVKTVTIDVTPVNDAPTAQDQSLDPNEGDTPTATLSGADRDGDQLTYGITRLPANGKLFEGEGTDGREVALGPNGEPFVLAADKVTYVPDDPDFDGDDSFEFVADDGEADSAPATVALDYVPVNDAPVVAFTNAGDTQSVDEGGRRTYEYTVTDVDGPANPEITESCGAAPAVYEDTPEPGSFRCLFPDGPDGHTVSVEADDGRPSENTGSDSVEVAVNNVRPTVTLSGPSTVQESATAERTYEFAVTDPGDDAFEVQEGFPTCGLNGSLVDGSLQSGADGGSFRCLFPDGDATSDVRIKVADSDGAADTDERVVTVTVRNVAPTATLVAPDSVDEGEEIQVSLDDPSDPAGGNDSTSYRFKCGDAPWSGWSPQSVRSCPATDDGEMVVRGQARDEDGGESEIFEKTVTVENVGPAVTAPADQSSDEGEEESFDLGSFTDPGADGPWSVSVDWGDGSEPTTFESDSPGSLGERGHAYADNGAYTVTVTVAEAGGGTAPSDAATFGVTVENVAPTATLANDGPVSEGSPATVSFSGQSDPSGADEDSLRYAYDCAGGSLDGATYAGASTEAARECVYEDQGEKTVRARVIDKDGGYTEYTTSFRVENAAPVADDRTVETEEEAEKAVTLTASDPGNDQLTYGITRLPANGKLFEGEGTGGAEITSASPEAPFVLAADKVTYVPAPDYNNDPDSLDSFGFRVSDGDGGSDAGTIRVRVTPVDDTPDARDDGSEDDPMSLEEDGGREIQVLGNDTGLGDGGIEVSIPTGGGPRKGTATVEDNVVAYTPDPDATGPDSFTYQVTDADGDTSTAVVYVDVTPVNDAPKPADDAETTPENTTLRIPVGRLTGNDSAGAANESGQTLRVADVGGATNGAVSLDDKNTGDPSDDEVVFVPARDHNGDGAGFTYRVCDDGEGDPLCSDETANVRVTVGPVNSVPEAGDGSAPAVPEDGEDVAIDLSPLVSDTETSDANLAYDIVSGPTPSQGRLTGTGPGFTFDPADDFFGTVEISYTVTDRGDPDDCGAQGAGCDGEEASAQGTFTVTVRPVNDPPRFRLGEDQRAEEDAGPQTVGGFATGVEPGPSNESDQNVAFTATSDDPGLFSDGPSIDPETGDLTYTPAAGASGSAVVTVRLTDDGGTPGDPADDETSTDTFTITIDPINRSPVVTFTDGNGDPSGQTRAFNESGTVVRTFTYTVTDADGPGEPRIDESCGDAPAEYVNTAEPNSFGCRFPDGPDTHEVRVTADDGVDTGSDTVEVTVDNLAPSVVPPANQTANEKAGKSFPLGSFTDPGADGPWSVTVNWGDGTPTETFATSTRGQLPARNHTYAADGSYTVRVTVAEAGTGETPSGEATFRVNVANLAPTAEDQSVSTPEETQKAITLTASDPGGDGLAYRITSLPRHGKLSAGGQEITAASEANPFVLSGAGITYVPEADFAGQDAFDFTACDDAAACDPDGATVSVTVSPANDAPAVTMPGSIGVTEDAPSPLTGVRASDPDAGNAEIGLTLSVPVGTGILAAQNGGGVRVSGSNSRQITLTGSVADVNAFVAAGNARFTTAANATGDVQLTVTANDQGNTGSGGAKSDTKTTTIKVTAVNDAPGAENDEATTAEDTPTTISVTANDDDLESGRALTVKSVASPANGRVEILTGAANAGKVRYTPNPDFNGVDRFTYTVEDGDGGTATATVTVNVTPTNDAPTARDDRASTGEAAAVSNSFISQYASSAATAPTRLYRLNTAQEPYTLDTIGNSIAQPLNAIGYRSTDRSLYGYRLTGTQGIMMINPKTTGYRFLGNPAGLPPSGRYNAGDVSVDGSTYYLYASKSGVLWKVDLRTFKATSVNLSSKVSAPDLSVNPIDGNLYGVASDGQLLQINPISGKVTARSVAGLVPGGYGATWHTAKGDLIVYENGTPQSNGTLNWIANPTKDPRVVSTQPGPYTRGNDGASYVAPPNPAGLKVEVDVLANDGDPDDALARNTLRIIQAPTKGSVRINADKTVTYTSNSSYRGSDSFRYQVCDSGTPRQCATATVNITSAPVGP